MKNKPFIWKSNVVILVSKQNKDFLESIIDFCYVNNIALHNALLR